MKVLIMKNQRKLFKSPTYIKVKPLEEYDGIISEYNYDNYINNNRYKILYNTNSNIKPNTKIKTRKNTENNDIDIKIIDDIINNKEKTNKIYKNDINNKRNKINFELKADIGMFDPITLKSNKNLSKDFLIKKENLKKMYDEGFARQTFLCCIFMEIQRIIKEIDSKIIFIKNQRNNVDVSTFLYMNQIYELYMRKELITNLDYLCSTNLEISAKTIVTINNK